MDHGDQFRLEFIVVEISESGKKRHLYLLGGREAGGMVEAHQTGIGHETVDELNLFRLEGERFVALVKSGLPVGGKSGDPVVEHVLVAAQGHCGDTPSGSAEIFRERVEAECIVGQHIHQRTEAVDERAIDIVGYDHQLRIVFLDDIHELVEHFGSETYAWRIGGIGDADGLH